MESKKEEYYSLGDITRAVRAFVLYLIRKWWLLLLAAIAGGALGMGYFLTQKPKYEAVCTFILEENQGAGGGLSSIASQFGFDVGGIGGGGNIFAGDNILDILKSKKVVREVLLSPQEKNAAGSGATLADLYIEFSGIKNKWKKKPELAAISFSGAHKTLNKIQDSALNIIYNEVLKRHLIADRANKKGTIIRVQVSAINDKFARQMTERLVNEASRMYLNIKTGTAQSNIDRMQRRSDSLLALLNNKSFTAANTQQLDINPGIKSAIVPTEIALRDKSVIATLYTEVTKNLEASKMLLSQQTPVIQVLDTPGDSLFDNKRSAIFCIIISAFIAMIMLTGLFAAMYFLKRMPSRKV